MPRRKFTTTLDADLLHQLKIRAAQENTDVSKILERLIADYLHHHKN